MRLNKCTEQTHTTMTIMHGNKNQIAKTHCPTGVLIIFAVLKIFIAMPKLVGPKAEPAAMEPTTSVPMAKAMQMPSAIGRILPITAIVTPLAPIALRVDKSISIPASITRRINLCVSLRNSKEFYKHNFFIHGEKSEATNIDC